MNSDDFPYSPNSVNNKEEWTDERRNKAIPVPPPTKERLPEETTEPEATPPPAPAPTKITGSAYGGWPYNGIGKIFFSSNGQDYVASGWMSAFSNPAGRMPIIMTAAHVLWDLSSKSWSTNVHIIIGYGGPSPVTVWPTGLQVTSKWQQQPDYPAGIPYDFASCYVNRADWTGQVLPMQWSQPLIDSSQHAIGYPAEPNQGYPFDGGSQWDQSGDMYSSTAPVGGDGELDMASWLSPGASGGPWIGWSGGARWVQALQSGWYGSGSGRCITPYFGSTFALLMSWTQQQWPNYAH